MFLAFFSCTSNPQPATAAADTFSLLSAVEADNEQDVKRHLSAGADASAVIQLTTTLGNLVIISDLLALGADVNAQCGDHNSALTEATRARHQKAAELLIQRGANVNTMGKLGDTALHCAVENDDEALVKHLLSAGADQGDGSLRIASAMGNVNVAQLLLERGADIDAATLVAGVRSGSAQIVQLLFDHANADIDLKGALEAAAETGHRQIFQILREKGAAVDGDILSTAALNGRKGIVQLITEQGIEEGYGKALYAAAKGGHLRIIQFLLAKGANINAEADFDDTALRAAVAHDQGDIVKSLLLAPDVSHFDGFALQYAVGWGRTQLVKQLLAAGVDADAQDGDVLVSAIRRANPRIVQILLENGAHVHQAALDTAKVRNHTQITELAKASHPGF